MPLIKIKNLVSFATNIGVLVHPPAAECSPDDLATAVRLAYAHLNDPLLTEACCGGAGPLAEDVGENLSF